MGADVFLNHGIGMGGEVLRMDFSGMPRCVLAAKDLAHILFILLSL